MPGSAISAVRIDVSADETVHRFSRGLGQNNPPLMEGSPGSAGARGYSPGEYLGSSQGELHGVVVEVSVFGVVAPSPPQQSLWRPSRKGRVVRRANRGLRARGGFVRGPTVV
jgi:hypothetical protein